MEPITTTIVAALAAGAAAAAKDTAGSAIKDAYTGLKKLIQGRFAGKPSASVALTEHEKKPETWKEPLKEALTETGADKDQEIVQKAQKLVKLLEQGGFTRDVVIASGRSVAAGKNAIVSGRDTIIGSRGRKKK
jgi:hypothetical protein